MWYDGTFFLMSKYISVIPPDKLLSKSEFIKYLKSKFEEQFGFVPSLAIELTEGVFLLNEFYINYVKNYRDNKISNILNNQP